MMNKKIHSKHKNRDADKLDNKMVDFLLKRLYNSFNELGKPMSLFYRQQKG